MNIRNISSIIFNIASWAVVIGYGLKAGIEYLPGIIRQWLINIPEPLVQIWTICFTLVFLSGGIFLASEFRANGLTKKFWNVVSGTSIFLLAVGAYAYMSATTLSGYRETLDRPFDFGDDFENIEQVIQSKDVEPTMKAQVSRIYAQYIYKRTGRIISVYDEQGQETIFEPSSLDTRDWLQTSDILKQGSQVTSTLIHRMIYSIIALITGLIIGLVLPKKHIIRPL